LRVGIYRKHVGIERFARFRIECIPDRSQTRIEREVCIDHCRIHVVKTSRQLCCIEFYQLGLLRIGGNAQRRSVSLPNGEQPGPGQQTRSSKLRDSHRY